MNRDLVAVLKLIVAFVAIPVAIWHLHPAPHQRWLTVTAYVVVVIVGTVISVWTDANRRNGR